MVENQETETQTKEMESNWKKMWSILTQQWTGTENIYASALTANENKNVVTKSENPYNNITKNQLYTQILPSIPSNLEFRQKRAKQASGCGILALESTP